MAQKRKAKAQFCPFKPTGNVTCKSCPTKLDGILYSQRNFLSLDVKTGGDPDSSISNYMVNTLQLDFEAPIITTGPCIVRGNCVCTSNYAGSSGPSLCGPSAESTTSTYGNYEQCSVSFGSSAKPLTVYHFDTEQRYDKLEVNGVAYHGSGDGPLAVTASTMDWTSDSSIQSTGWKICVGAPSGALLFNCGNPCKNQTIDLESIHGLVAGDVFIVRLRETNAASVGGDVAVIAASYNTGSLERPFFGLQ